MKTNFLSLVAVGLISIFTVTPASAQITGKEIMENVYNIPSGDDMQGELVMTLVNNRGEQRVRNLKQFSMDDGKVEKKIMFFLAPADVRNTSFMNWSYSDGREDDQWIYLPALKRIKRISSDGKSDYFMGSDFTYDDLGDRHPDEDNHKLIREESIDGNSCYVVESTPKTSGYMYSKTISWVIKDSFLGIKREFYDSKGKLLKTLTIKKFDEISGIWTILETEMNNVQKNHKTLMEFTNVQYNQGLKDNWFTERTMTTGI